MTATKINTFLGWLIEIRPLSYGNKYQRRNIIKSNKKQDEKNSNRFQ